MQGKNERCPGKMRRANFSLFVGQIPFFVVKEELIFAKSKRIFRAT